MEKKKFQPDQVLSYFKSEWPVLLAVTISGLIYNIGLLAGPWFEGRMAGKLIDILQGRSTFQGMLFLVLAYVAAIGIVQSSRYIKRFYVRRFANNVNRKMKQVLYANLVDSDRPRLEEEGAGNVMTKAILDVDDCAEGMRKFTTEVFDTGVALVAYAAMLFWYDWRLALLCLIFPPVSYLLAEKMKVVVQRTGAIYKEQSGRLSAATLDRGFNAITYRVFGCEKERQRAYEENLSNYEKAAVKANIWNAIMPPIYRVISMTSVLFILYFGWKNVLGEGWSVWTIAIFTTFLSCFSRLAAKSSSAAKLFNAVHKAQVSWKRIKPLMKEPTEEAECQTMQPGSLKIRQLSFTYPNGQKIFENLNLKAEPGQIIGITGAVACGKSTLGKVFLCEYPYTGSIRFAGRELGKMDRKHRAGVIGYLGHDPELFNDTVENNILMGIKLERTVQSLEKIQESDAEENGERQKAQNLKKAQEKKTGNSRTEAETWKWLKEVCLDEEVKDMESSTQTMIGNTGVRLSGGQAKRLALARTLCHKKPILILDDPFSALDKKTEGEVFENLQRLAKDSIVLLISHRLYLFPELDQVIFMENGKTKVGSHEQFMKEIPAYAELFKAQAPENTKVSESL